MDPENNPEDQMPKLIRDKAAVCFLAFPPQDEEGPGWERPQNH